jgi:hypothetical protein
MNFGMSGFNLENQYCYKKKFAENFKIDQTLYFIHEADILSRAKKNNFFCYLENDSLCINSDFLNNYRKTNLLSPLKKIRILKFIKRNFNVYRDGDFWKKVLDKFYFKEQEIKKIKSKKIPNIYYYLIKEIEKEKGIIVVLDDSQLIKDLLKNFEGKVINLSIMTDRKELSYWKATNVFGHWNYEGHLLLAKKLFEELN